MFNALRHQRCVQFLLKTGLACLFRGVQRLTASKVCPVTQRRRLAYSQKDKCSTPYGIKGVSSRSEARTLPNPLGCGQRLTASKVCPVSRSRKSCRTWKTVLNALRHQRCVQFKSGSALPKSGSGVQRLTASKVCPVKGLKPPIRVSLVLNALRHQRCVQ